MIARENWDVLVVDDEPDVLAVTRLALKQILPAFDVIGENNFRSVPEFSIRTVVTWLQSVRSRMVTTDRRR